MRTIRLSILIASAVMIAAGCNESDRLATYQVTGKVLFPDGKPLVDGKVMFVSRNHDVRARGRIEVDGSYDLSTFEAHDGAVEGPHQIMVLPFFDRPDEPPTIDVHRKFQQFATSGLEFTVTPEGPNVFDVTIEAP